MPTPGGRHAQEESLISSGNSRYLVGLSVFAPRSRLPYTPRFSVSVQILPFNQHCFCAGPMYEFLTQPFSATASPNMRASFAKLRLHKLFNETGCPDIFQFLAAGRLGCLSPSSFQRFHIFCRFLTFVCLLCSSVPCFDCVFFSCSCLCLLLLLILPLTRPSSSTSETAPTRRQEPAWRTCHRPWVSGACIS